MAVQKTEVPTTAQEEVSVEGFGEYHVVAENLDTQTALKTLQLNKGSGLQVIVDDSGKVRIVLRELRLPAGAVAKISHVEKSKLI